MDFRKAIAFFAAAELSLTCLAGCGEKDGSSVSTAESGAVVSEAEKTPETPEEWHEAMIRKAMYSYGNTSKMQEKIKKAQSGEKVTVAYLGGSITEGLTAGDSDCYAKLTYDYFAEKFGTGDNVEYCNAGLSGTPSTLGILRLERDVLQYEPDVCFIEFAVNDGTDAEYQNAYESIVRELLERDVAVVLLFSVTAEDYSAQDYMKAIGEHYSLPMISYCDALRYMFENNQMKWEDFSDDQSHPNTEGHRLVAEMVDYYFDTVMDVQAEEYVYPSEPFYSPRQLGAHLYENTSLTPESLGSWTEGTDVASFTDGWSYSPGEGNEPLKFKFTGKFVYLIYKEMKQGNFGPVHVKVTCNGELYNELDVDPVSPSGWGNPQIINIGMQAENTEYEIEISMAEGSEDNAMQILGFGYTLDS
ncbi:SGNH/GDSL hydrolase family protein [Ruminococcus sp. Marseille-P6503]|uniref:SGNH/GDSL hydrolase family protein n=1 Tax=Ruminococcus sp. Marseille-P6503 TaxID=2364796 RepID=UPI000F5358EE|nr:SGNH/GDSL hydrolase family protein [Ruminococcus sp. Marseille-P6503]